MNVAESVLIRKLLHGVYLVVQSQLKRFKPGERAGLNLWLLLRNRPRTNVELSF